MQESIINNSPVSAMVALRLSIRNFRKLASFIESELGIKMPESNVQMLQGRLAGRVRQLGMESIDEYCDHLFSGTGAVVERFHIFNAVTTNKTDFYREPQHFRYLIDTALPALERIRRSSLAVWSAACSTGEEPYTLAMVLSEYAATHPGFGFRILGTDISSKVLEQARRGIYTKEQISPVPALIRRKYLLAGGGDHASLYRLIPPLRRAVSFHELNFMSANYGISEKFDVIFCRNVLIYFDRGRQESVINKLCTHLVPGGYLFIGHSESLSGMNVPVTSVGSACYRKPCVPEEANH